MPKRSSYEIQTGILGCVKEGKCNYAELERKLGTGFRTVKSNCELLEGFGQIKIHKLEKHPANGKPSYDVSITESGMESLTKAKKKTTCNSIR